MTKFVVLMLFFATAFVFLNFVEADGHGEHHHVIIHVPYKVKTIRHTHTITKHIHHKDEGGDKYEVLGYTLGHPTDLGGLGLGHGDGGGKDLNLLGSHELGGHDWSSGISQGGKGLMEGMEAEHVVSYQSLGNEHSGGHSFIDTGYSDHQSFSEHQ